jgi:hypothetical protein
MATARTTAVALADIVTLFSTPKIKKAKLTSVKIDNQSAAAKTIHFRDDFTPDASVGVPSPSAQQIEKLQVTVGAGLTADIPETELRNKEFLGDCKCYADAADAACIIIIDYEFC